MAKKYTYSRTIQTIHGHETFTASEFDAFDEAQQKVDKGIHDRRLELAEEMKNRPVVNQGNMGRSNVVAGVTTGPGVMTPPMVPTPPVSGAVTLENNAKTSA